MQNLQIVKKNSVTHHKSLKISYIFQKARNLALDKRFKSNLNFVKNLAILNHDFILNKI